MSITSKLHCPSVALINATWYATFNASRIRVFSRRFFCEQLVRTWTIIGVVVGTQWRAFDSHF